MYGRHAKESRDAINTDTKKAAYGAEKKTLEAIVT